MDLKKQLQQYDNTLEKEKTTYSGLMGLGIGGTRKVDIPNRPGYVYVRLRDNLSEVVQVFNDKVSPVYDFPVLIQRKGNRWTVVGRDDQRYDNWGTSAPFLPTHGDQHSFNRDGGGGGDPVFVYPDQFMPLLVYPSGTVGSSNLLIAPYVLQRDSDFIYVGNTGTTNLLVYKPTNAQAIVGLVYLDRSSGNPGVLIASGTPMPATITGTAGILPYLPFPSSTQEPLYAFRLLSGTTALTWSNLNNVRQLVGKGSIATGTSSGGISGVGVWDEGIPQGTGTIFNFVGDNVSVSVSGTVARVYVTGSAGSSLPSFVTGSVPYAGSNGILKEDNIHFRWMEDLRGLRIGQNHSLFDLADIFPIGLVGNNVNQAAGLGVLVYGTGTSGSPSSTYNGYRSRGTLTSPLPVQRDDALLTIIGNGFDGANWQNATRLRFYADGNFVTGSVLASRMEFEVTPSGSATRRTQLYIYGDSINQPAGSTYNIDGRPHTHSASDIVTGTINSARLPESTFSQVLFFHGAGATVAGGGTSYMYPGREGFVTLGGNAFPKAGTIKNLYFKTNSAQPGTGSLVCTVQKNLVNTTCVVTIAAGSGATQGSDLTHFISFAAGDVITLTIKNNAATASATVTYVSVEFVFAP